MECFHCGENVSLAENMKEWEENFGEDAVLDEEMPIYINLICDHCNKSIAAIFIEKTVKEEKVDTPIGEVTLSI